jgi:hypothetical protein
MTLKEHISFVGHGDIVYHLSKLAPEGKNKKKNTLVHTVFELMYFQVCELLKTTYHAKLQ